MVAKGVTYWRFRLRLCTRLAVLAKQLWKYQFSGRRSAPVPQLKCVGGSARGRFKPRAAQCFKQGYDGIDYQWKCTADMPSEYEFGAVRSTFYPSFFTSSVIVYDQTAVAGRRTEEFRSQWRARASTILKTRTSFKAAVGWVVVSSFSAQSMSGRGWVLVSSSFGRRGEES